MKNLLDSYRRWMGEELIARSGDEAVDTATLFAAPFAVVSHGTQSDPVFWFGNRVALELFELDWEAFTRLPSRFSAEPVERAERERLLAEVTRHGHLRNYAGVRVSARGRRFRIEAATVWNVHDPSGTRVGQAAAFSRWVPLTSSGAGSP
jgi:hypothetical protein